VITVPKKKTACSIRSQKIRSGFPLLICVLFKDDPGFSWSGNAGQTACVRQVHAGVTCLARYWGGKAGEGDSHLIHVEGGRRTQKLEKDDEQNRMARVAREPLPKEKKRESCKRFMPF